MVDLVNTTSGITKLNNHNYKIWRSCITSYLEGQELWLVINGIDDTPPNDQTLLPIWKAKAGKVMYVLKSTIEDELIQKIMDINTPKMAWDTLRSLFVTRDNLQGIGDERITREALGQRKLDPDLYKAAREGDVSRLSEINGENMTEEVAMSNQHGKFLKSTQYGDNNILHIAARAGRDKFVAEVLRRFPFLSEKVNSQRDSPLLVAARFGHLEVVKELTKSSTEQISRQVGTAPAAENETNPSSSHPQSGAEEDIDDHPLEAGNIPVGMATALENQTNSSISHHRREVGEGIVDHQLEQGTLPDSIIINMEDVINSGDMATATEEGPVHLQLDGLIPYQWRVTNLEQGTTVTVTTALHEALRNGHEDVARYLLGLKPEQAAFYNLAGESPLFLAAESRCELFISDILLSKQGYSTKGPDGLNVLHAAHGCCGETIYLLIEKNSHLLTEFDNRGKAAIHHAIEADYESLLDQILKYDALIALLSDAEGYTPLLKASIRGRWDFCLKILEVCPESIEARNRKGQNALHLCQFWNSYHLGLKFFGIPEIRKLLNVVDDEGNTPLHLAVKLNDYEKAMLLTSWESIDLGAVNKKGLTALDLCESDWKNLNHKRLMWLHLRKCGAPRGRRPNEHKVPVGGLKGIMGCSKEDTARHSQTMSLAAALIATLTFTAALTMPGGYDDLVGAAPLKKATHMIFIFSDTLAMCCSITVVYLLLRAMIVGEGLKIVLNNASGKLLRIAIYATLVAYMSGVFALIPPKVLWVAILVCVICAMVPCLFWPDIVQRSAPSIMLVKTWIQIKRCLPCVQLLISWWIKIKYVGIRQLK